MTFARRQCSAIGKLAAFALVLVASCGKVEPDRGGLMLLLSEDGELGLDRLELRVTAGDKLLLESSYRLPMEASLPTTVSIVSNNNPTATAAIHVVGWRGKIPVDVRDNIVKQIPVDRVTALRIVLSARCTDQVVLVDGEATSKCDDGSGTQTCSPTTGDCVKAEVNASELDVYESGDENSPAGGGAPSLGEGGDSNGPGPGGASDGGAGATAGAGGAPDKGGAVSGGMTTGGSAGALGTAGKGGNPPVAGTSSDGGDGNAGAAGAGGTVPVGDTPPLRPLMVDPVSALNTKITFTAKQLDPLAGTSPTATNASAFEYGFVDTTKKVQGKLVMTLGGISTCCGQGGIGGYAVGLGFHHLAIAIYNSSGTPASPVPEASRTDEENRQMGDGRMEAWDGDDRVSWLDINVHDSFAYRASLGLQYMQQQDPGGDWAYFLNADKTVRWSDVYLVGYSLGSQTLAVVSKYVRIGRGIATSGPVDEGFPNATWLHAPSATPLNRMYGLFGASDLNKKVETTQAAGWLGDPLTVDPGVTTLFLGTAHLFILQGQGHSEFCVSDGGVWKELCQYAFGVPP